MSSGSSDEDIIRAGVREDIAVSLLSSVKPSIPGSLRSTSAKSNEGVSVRRVSASHPLFASAIVASGCKQ